MLLSAVLASTAWTGCGPGPSHERTTSRSASTTAATAAPLAPPASADDLAVAPARLRAGGRLRVRGVGFCPSAAIALGHEPETGREGPDLDEAGTGTADESGSFDTVVSVAASMAPGRYRLYAFDATTATAGRPAPACTDHTATALFTIT